MDAVAARGGVQEQTGGCFTMVGDLRASRRWQVYVHLACCRDCKAMGGKSGSELDSEVEHVVFLFELFAEMGACIVAAVRGIEDDGEWLRELVSSGRWCGGRLLSIQGKDSEKEEYETPSEINQGHRW